MVDIGLYMADIGLYPLLFIYLKLYFKSTKGNNRINA